MRKQRCFPDRRDFQQRLSGLSAQQKETLEAMIGERSSWFRATIWVTIGTTRYTLYSLLYRNDGTNLVRPILRSAGTP
jgi:type II secretory pathway component PulK